MRTLPASGIFVSTNGSRLADAIVAFGLAFARCGLSHMGQGVFRAKNTATETRIMPVYLAAFFHIWRWTSTNIWVFEIQEVDTLSRVRSAREAFETKRV